MIARLFDVLSVNFAETTQRIVWSIDIDNTYIYIVWPKHETQIPYSVKVPMYFRLWSSIAEY